MPMGDPPPFFESGGPFDADDIPMDLIKDIVDKYCGALTIEEVRTRLPKDHQQYPWPGGMNVQIGHYNTLVEQSKASNIWRLHAEAAEKKLAERDASLLRAAGKR